MGSDSGPVRIFVGADRSQMLALRVLERSVRSRTDRPVEIRSLADVTLPVPADPRNRQRTGFSFARFAIPALADFKGRAIYLDADMLVLKDVSELWMMDFGGAKVICQEEPPASNRGAFATRRAKQCSVMLLDCARLDWDAAEIIGGLGQQYDYLSLMRELCILDEDDVAYTLPFRWNSLEHVQAETCLVHYTDMPTQPWVCATNPNGWLWMNEVRTMLAEGSLTHDELREERERGYLRPSFLEELGMVEDSRSLSRAARAKLARVDRKARFVPHAELNEARRKLAREIDAKSDGRLFTTSASPMRRVLEFIRNRLG